jgi:hypothetical protein
VSSIQLLWDYVTYTYASSPRECYYYYEPESMFGVLGFTFIKIIVLDGFPLSLYLVFFTMNR